MARSIVLTLATLAGVMGHAVSRAENFPITPIHWEPCPAPFPPSVDCGKIAVPMDHGNLLGGTITLGLVRRRANATKPVGNLVVNPGGPGGPASGFLLQQVLGEAAGTPFTVLSKTLTSQYNIIAPDPRGVGLSNPVKCDAKIYNQRVPNYITSQDDFDKLVAWNKALGASCLQMTGPSLKFLDTISAAKDLDYVRLALGDSKLNYLGFSYGSQLGSQYAELFPNNVGRMILDGVLDHSATEVPSLVTETTTIENTLNEFFKWCNTTSDCAFHGQDLPAIFDTLIDNANKKPIPAPQCLPPDEAAKQGAPSCRSDVTGYELLAGVQGSLIFPTGLVNGYSWVNVSQDLHKAYANNDASIYSAPLATNNTSSVEESIFPSSAIGCQDWLHRGTANDLLARLIAMRALAPHTRGVTGTLIYQTVCIGWPTPLTNPQRPLSRDRLANAPPILLVNSFHDPETSIAWAVGLREQMPTAVSLFRDGSGHTSYDNYGDLQKVMDAFLIAGTVPKDLTIYKS
ncbi:Serine protease Hip1-like protein [Cladobotryum mycophilum]|uniref:Serine protease Hip1-like protein n=1 Tax=Cladobotryum mycophilum TaxID=491253 RepID=A0ABR0SHT3_9HYPO